MIQRFIFLMNIELVSVNSIFCRKDDVDVGLMLLSEAKEDGITPNLTMFKCVIGKF